jgi:hypothetical protein
MNARMTSYLPNILSSCIPRFLRRRGFFFYKLSSIRVTSHWYNDCALESPTDTQSVARCGRLDRKLGKSKLN